MDEKKSNPEFDPHRDLLIRPWNEPPGKPGSFTRFVLPFAYRVAPWKSGQEPKRYYQEGFGVSPSEMAERRAYFTADTGFILFDRTKWFELNAAVTTHTIAGRDLKPLKIAMPPPRLVLPEWPAKIEAKSEHASREVLRTGFLIIEARFLNEGCEWQMRDLLAFNETFRYWRRPWPGLEREVRKGFEGYIYRDMVPGYDPNDPFFGRWEQWLRLPLKVGGQFLSIVPGAEDGTMWIKEARRWQESSEGKPGWIPYADNRTFVWTCALVKDDADKVRKNAYGNWVKLLNVDPPKDTPESPLWDCTEFEREWAEERTYKRWEHDGTTHGFSYHSGAVLGPADHEWIAGVFGKIYFDLLLILFYLRVTCFRFSRELCTVSTHLPVGEKTEGAPFVEEFRRLRLSFALLTNLYEFPLLSNQQQGMEMYAIAKRHLDVKELFDETRDKISAAHEFVEMQLAHEQNQQILKLTKVAQYGLVLVLVVTFFGTEPLRDWFRPRYISLMKSALSAIHFNPYYASALGDIAAAILLSIVGGFFFHLILEWLLSRKK